MAVAPAESTARGPADFSSRAADLAAAIRLGYEVERDDPNIGFESAPDNEIEWLAAWLVLRDGPRSDDDEPAPEAG